MSWTKRQFVTQAFEELGLAAYVFDLYPEQMESAMKRLDAMMATWNAKGIRLGYPIPGSPENGSLSDETSVPDAANEAIFLNLAVRLAPSFGKTVSPDTKLNAKSAYDNLLSLAAAPVEMQLPGTLPLGAGNKPWGINRPFVTPPIDPLLVGQDGQLDFN